MKNILITGGAGFIGSHLAELLVKKGYKITIFDNFSIGNKNNLKNINKKIRLLNIDIRDFKKLLRNFEKFDVVFHLAALADIVPSITNPKNYISTNVEGTSNILICCKKFKIKRIIYTASSSCYGIPKTYPTKEISEIGPKYPYALSKWLGEEIVMHFSKIYKMNCTSLRLFNVYGPRARTSGTYGAVFGVFLAQKLANKPFTVVGSGNQKRDFTYVSDVTDCLYKVSKRKDLSSEIYNVGSGKTVSVNKIIKILGGSTVKIPKRRGEPFITFANILKIKKKIGWTPKISIEKGIKLMLDNIDYWKDAPVWTSKKISLATKDWFKYLN